MSEEQNEPNRKQTIWGINPSDDIWFTTITTVGSIAFVTALAVTGIQDEANPTTHDILWVIGRSAVIGFPTTGFATWVGLNIKDGIMSMGDYFRRKSDEHEAIIRNQGIQLGREEGRQEGRQEGENAAISRMISRAEATGNDAVRDFLIRESNGEHPEN